MELGIDIMMWEPIETAPRDGSEIIVFMDEAGTPVVHVARWEDDPPEWETGWWSFVKSGIRQERLEDWGRVLFWMALPERPLKRNMSKKTQRCMCGIISSCHLRCADTGITESHCLSCLEEMVISGDYQLIDENGNVWELIEEERL